MSGIAGINKPNQFDLVEKMLNKISHRGKFGKKIFSTQNSTLGIVNTQYQSRDLEICEVEKIIKDDLGDGHLAYAKENGNTIELFRDEIGVSPLYYGFNDNVICFASEVKSLMEATKNIFELPPGHKLINNNLIRYYQLNNNSFLKEGPQKIADQLFKLLENSVKKRINGNEIGSWLSGGLDSSVLASLARMHVDKLYTFSTGIKDAPDLQYARVMAEYLKSQHHEIIVSVNDMIHLLPEVIYYLESFDALLVRSSITNYLTAKEASNYVEQVFSGEGGDELFGGYHFLKELPISKLNDELVDITNRLHNTALQRVDRCASAFGTVAHVAFLDLDVVNYVMKIPPEYKIYNGTEKWILRLAMKNHLPVKILNRTKAKFWEGAGVGEFLSDYADKKITDSEFKSERILKNGWVINSKEELMYYRIFREHFGDLKNLDWMGKTKN
ncbi:MAG: asparagine synthase-related protein [Melioribacter sp.]|uniref:asparagine synthase-related protein n=1 Tax=Rosettibacter primus TaxID=3111523 RepID=UPI00247B98C0|nr:asparagine synthase-related protein [Melioribacter sp.]